MEGLWFGVQGLSSVSHCRAKIVECGTETTRYSFTPFEINLNASGINLNVELRGTTSIKGIKDIYLKVKARI